MDNLSWDTIVTILLGIFAAGSMTELTKSIINSYTGRARRKRKSKEREAAISKIHEESSEYWRAMAYEVRNVGQRYGIPLEDFPTFDPPTINDED